METSISRNQTTGVDTSERTVTLDKLKAEKAEKVQAVRSNQDLTPEARNRTLSEVAAGYDQKITAAARDVVDRLDAQIEREYRRANPIDKPSTDHTAELLREMRRSRIDGEVMEALTDGVDGVRMYQEALRLGDTERADAIARLAPRWLDSVRRRELAKMVDERTPQTVRDARERLQRLENEKRSITVGLTMQGIRV